MSGYPDQSVARWQETLALAQALGNSHSEAEILVFGVIALQLRREPQAARTQAVALMKLSNEHLMQWMGVGIVLNGWAQAQLGEGDDNLTEINRGLEMWRATGAELLVPYLLGILAETQRLSGQIEVALESVAEAKALVNRSDERWFEADLHRLEGELLLDQHSKQHKKAQVCLERALKVARTQQAKSLELRAAVSLSRLWQKQGKCDEARHLLGSIYSSFTEGFNPADRQEAKSLF